MTAHGPVLKDIHVPPAAWWPPAPGWWIVAGLVVLAALVVAWLLWRRRLQRPLRAAMREIDALDAAWARDGDAARLVDGASRLLRRVACRTDPVAASRSGDAWRGFVHQYAPDAATKEAMDRLDETRYLANPELNAAGLLAALRVWCRHALRLSPSPHQGEGEPGEASPRTSSGALAP